MMNLVQKIRSLDPVDFSIQLTIFFTLVHFSSQIYGHPMLYIPIIIASSIGVLFSEVRRSKLFWFIQISFYALWTFNNWQLIDNHRFLWLYWLIAIFVGLFHHNPNASIRTSAQYLIATCMAFAVIQKAMSGDYTSSNFFLYHLITDSRFAFLDSLVDTNMRQLIYTNKEALSLVQKNSTKEIISLGPPIIATFATIITWYTITIEMVLSGLFFLPKKLMHYWQHVLLLVFSTIYFLLPIKGFAFTLLIMGFCCLKKSDTAFKWAYLFFIIYIYCIANYFNELLF